MQIDVYRIWYTELTSCRKKTNPVPANQLQQLQFQSIGEYVLLYLAMNVVKYNYEGMIQRILRYTINWNLNAGCGEVEAETAVLHVRYGCGIIFKGVILSILPLRTLFKE